MKITASTLLCKIYLWFLAFIVCCSAMGASTAEAQPQLDQSNVGEVTAGTAINISEFAAQVITAGKSGILASVDFAITKFDGFTFGDITLQIRGVTSGVPNSTILGSKTFANSSIASTPAEFTTFDLSSLNVFLHAGDVFSIVVVSANQSGSPFPIALTDNLYAGGDLFASTDGTNWVSFFGRDTRFRTFVGNILIVTNRNDSGAGSLRQAIVTANGDVAPNAIIFDATIFPATIFLQSQLPALTGTGDLIDGHVNGTAAVTLHGGCSGPDAFGDFLCPLPTGDGIQVRAGNVMVSGLKIRSFPSNGVDIRPGVNVTGVSILDNQILSNQLDGITVSGGPGGNQVEVHIIGNRVEMNGDDNITVFGSSSTGTGGNTVDVVISENLIRGAKGSENATFTGDGVRVTGGNGDNVGNNQITVLISDNNFRNMADSAVSIIGGAANGSSSNNVIDVTISGNEARNSGLAGNGTSYTLSAGTSSPTMSTGNVLTFAVVSNISNGVVGPGIFVNTGNGSDQFVSGTIANNEIKNSSTNIATGVLGTESSLSRAGTQALLKTSQLNLTPSGTMKVAVY